MQVRTHLSRKILTRITRNKGSPGDEKCGFSRKMVALLQESGFTDFGHFDILLDNEVSWLMRLITLITLITLIILITLITLITLVNGPNNPNTCQSTPKCVLSKGKRILIRAHHFVTQITHKSASLKL